MVQSSYKLLLRSFYIIRQILHYLSKNIVYIVTNMSVILKICRPLILLSPPLSPPLPLPLDDIEYIIVGAGLSGLVLAEKVSRELDKKVLIVEKRYHVGGNCFDYIDNYTGIRINKYGAHIFHTNYEDVWEYINRFSEWIRWDHTVLACIDDMHVPIPVNMTTINMLCNENLKNEDDARIWLDKNQIKYDNITNSEQVAKSRIGCVLYNKLIKYYTFKQWGMYPDELDKSVLERIPIVTSSDPRYFNDKYQCLPKHGYSSMFNKMIDNPRIKLVLNTDFFDFRNIFDITNKKIIYTGPIDSYFSSHRLPKLDYRSINFDIRYVKNMNYYQNNSVINFPSNDVPHTRIIEYKHFLNQKSKHTIIVSETTNNNGEPYYPIPNKKNSMLYEKYNSLALNEKNTYFVGRLANYKYFNMDQTIKNALVFYENIILKNKNYYMN